MREYGWICWPCWCCITTMENKYKYRKINSGSPKPPNAHAFIFTVNHDQIHTNTIDFQGILTALLCWVTCYLTPPQSLIFGKWIGKNEFPKSQVPCTLNWFPYGRNMIFFHIDVCVIVPLTASPKHSFHEKLDAGTPWSHVSSRSEGGVCYLDVTAL